MLNKDLHCEHIRKVIGMHAICKRGNVAQFFRIVSPFLSQPQSVLWIKGDTEKK